MEMALGLVANRTSCYHLVNITSHFGAIGVLSQDVNGFAKAKMAS